MKGTHMKRYAFTVFAVLTVLGLMSVPFHHADAIVLRSGEKIITEKDERTSDDSLVAAGQSEINSTTDGDLYIAGGEITINGDVLRDLIIFGGNITVNGKVTDDLLIAGGNIVVNSPSIGDNVTIAGGNVKIADMVTIGGDLTGGAGAFEFSGKVMKHLNIAAQAVDLRGQVDGSAELRAEEINISKTARVTGNLDYYSKSDAKIDKEAVVRGTMVKHDVKEDTATWFSQQQSTTAMTTKALIGMLSMMVTGLVFVKLFPRKSAAIIADTPKNAWKYFGIGIGILFLAPVPLLFLMLTIIGLPLGLIGLGLYILLMYLGKVYLAIFLGWKLFSLFKKTDIMAIQSGQLVWSVIFGGIIMGLIELFQFIPGIGMVLGFLFMFVGVVIFVGSLASFDVKFLKQTRTQQML